MILQTNVPDGTEADVLDWPKSRRLELDGLIFMTGFTDVGAHCSLPDGPEAQMRAVFAPNTHASTIPRGQR